MPTPTYTPLATKTLTSSASSVSFSSIVGSYRDLILVCGNLNSNTGSNGIRIKVNNDTSSVYTSVHAAGNGSSAISFANGNTGFGQLMGNAGLGTASNNTLLVNFMDYSATDKHKTWLVRANQASDNTEMVAGRWPSTSAITQIDIYLSANSFTTGSVFSLFGVIS